MAEGKSGSNCNTSPGGAGHFAKRVQRSLSRAQEKVLQKLGKSVETKDEHFELCVQNLSKQQSDGSKLFKDLKAYYTSMKAMRETSKRLSQTLLDVYESDWEGDDDLPAIVEGEDLLWKDYEEKLGDQVIRTMDTYMSQFPDVKERVAKRGRKLVDYDFSRHQLETLQNAKKKDEPKIAKAEEELNYTQSVFEEINTELRQELPVLYQSRIGCYVTVFQNLSNLLDVFYKEMSTLNGELYSMMKSLETQHSDKVFIIKGLQRSASNSTKKRRSFRISSPLSRNIFFPALDQSTSPVRTQKSTTSSREGLGLSCQPMSRQRALKPRPPRKWPLGIWSTQEDPSASLVAPEDLEPTVEGTSAAADGTDHSPDNSDVDGEGLKLTPDSNTPRYLNKPLPG
ncbi:hypothetical protein AAFF_G00242120 [Aldrovandia affinis]|uniref:BAR domain-containing protein n=1 Tax=Aldrovandia affinis TaxID=143900 RepID=A0AAD7SWM8_9TELE|nr:hypothetical protein AAFF_G00242120 [Aldrovandia affinis]